MIPSQNVMARGASPIARSRFVASRLGATDTGSAAKPRTITFQPPLGKPPENRVVSRITYAPRVRPHSLPCLPLFLRGIGQEYLLFEVPYAIIVANHACMLWLEAYGLPVTEEK